MPKPRPTKPRPSAILPGGIVVMDEPAHCNVTVFADRGEVLLVFNGRDDGVIGQIFVGLTGNQTLQLIDRLTTHYEFCTKAAREGRGGSSWPGDVGEGEPRQ